MKTLAVVSGKGGTGKTCVTAGLLPFLPRPVLCDADVDAANLHLLTRPEPARREPFTFGRVARIMPEACSGCLECFGVCRFQALEATGEDLILPSVDPLSCEGCGLCAMICPSRAITMEDHETGSWIRSRTSYGPLVHARLGPGGENSGALVEKVRREAEQVAAEEGRELILVDGPPGIGCPAIATLSGVDLALVVTEPTPSGRDDLLRVLRLIRHFGIQAMVVVNKSDLHPALSEKLVDRLTLEGVPVAARFPYDLDVTEAVRAGKILSEISDLWHRRFDWLWRSLQGPLFGAEKPIRIRTT